MFVRVAARLRRHGLEIAIAGGVLLLIIAAAVASESTVEQLRARSEATSLAETARMGDLIAQRFGQEEMQIDWLQRIGALATLALQQHHQEEFDTLNALMRRATQGSGSLLLQVGAIDPLGNVLWSTLPMPPNVPNLSAREHFVAIAHDGLDHFVGRPVRGAISGQNTIQFSSAVRRPDASLAAVIVVSMDAQQLQPLAGDLHLGPTDTISLLRADGVVLARSRDERLDQAAHSADLLDTLRTGAALDILRPGMVNGRLRFLSARRVPDTNMFVLFGRDAATILAPTKQFIGQIRNGTILVILVLVAFGAALVMVAVRSRRLREAEQHNRELAQSEAVLRQIAEQAPDLISLQDAQMHYIYANPAFHDLLGVATETIPGRRLGFSVIAEDREQVAAAMARLARDGGTERATYRARGRDGRMLWFDAQGVAFSAGPDDAPESRRYVTIARNVTHLKEIEQELHEAREHLATLLRNSPGMLYTLSISPDGMWNSAIPVPQEFLGYDKATLSRAWFLRSHLSSGDLAARAATIQRCLANGHASMEYRFPAANGETRWLRDSMNRGAPHDADRSIVGYITDITEERETKLRLQQAERLASLGEMATGVAHEINQPLALISLAAHNALRPAAGQTLELATLVAALKLVSQQATRIGQVVSHVRMFGRSAATEGTEFGLADAVTEALLLVEQRLQAEGLAVEMDVPSDLPSLRAPRLLLEQALMNLVVNACDAYCDRPHPNAGGPPRPLTISARQEGLTLVLRVADRAGGIPANVIGRVFDPFFTTKPPGKGTGLGLSISFSTITEMRGDIRVRNEDGGAVFEIRLPLTSAPATAMAS